MQKNYTFGLSFYVSTFEEEKVRLARLPVSSPVFTSFHVQEEIGEEYKAEARRMMQSLQKNGHRIIADVSPKTFAFFDTKDIVSFARQMKISCLRVDYGFTTDELAAIASEFPIAINASTIDMKGAAQISEAAAYEVCALHNFYPRPETGLDEATVASTTRELQSLGIKVFAFIPGDAQKRGPLFEGLPTLESHRGILPYVACVELLNSHGLDGVFVGDIDISKQQFSLIIDFLHDDEIRIPCLLYGHDNLYDRSFTIRPDSPLSMLRLFESREYSSCGAAVEPVNNAQRAVGTITMDNVRYARYSGEIQIIKQPLPADRRVNVIGHIDVRYLRLLNCVKNGQKIRMIRSW